MTIRIIATTSTVEQALCIWTWNKSHNDSMRQRSLLPTFSRWGNEVHRAWFIQSHLDSKWQSWDLNPNQYPTSPFVTWDYCANQATNEPARIQLPSLSLCHCFFFFLTPSMHCQAHSVKCFQIRVLPCSLSDSLVSTPPTSWNSSWKVLVAITKIFFSSLLHWLVSKSWVMGLGV